MENVDVERSEQGATQVRKYRATAQDGTVLGTVEFFPSSGVYEAQAEGGSPERFDSMSDAVAHLLREDGREDVFTFNRRR